MGPLASFPDAGGASRGRLAPCCSWKGVLSLLVGTVVVSTFAPVESAVPEVVGSVVVPVVEDAEGPFLVTFFCGEITRTGFHSCFGRSGHA
jgi:hypothetical protein